MLASQGHNPKIRGKLGELYIRQQKLGEALGEYKEIEKFEAGNLDARLKIGLIYLEQDKLNEAIAEFQLILSANPELHRIRYYLAMAYGEKEDMEKAIEELKKIPEGCGCLCRFHDVSGLIPCPEEEV